MIKPPKSPASTPSKSSPKPGRANNRRTARADAAISRADAPRPQLQDPKRAAKVARDTKAANAEKKIVAAKKARFKKPHDKAPLATATEIESPETFVEKLEGEKLQKVLARAGLGSRRDMEKSITEGRVTVNGKVAKLGDRIGDDDKVLLNDSPVELRTAEERQTRVLIYNKPEGEICSARDPEGRPTVFDKLPRLRGERWIAVGRLDFNTSGLLLFTTDGELANALMHPSANIDREYLCRVMGEVTEDKLALLKEGVMLEDGMARFNDITEGGGAETSINRWYYVCLMEGRNREVRRLWESQELKVSRLKRVRYGPVFLPAKVKQGQWMDLPPEEIRHLYERANLKLPTSKKAAFNRREASHRGEKQRSEKPRGARTMRRPRAPE